MPLMDFLLPRAHLRYGTAPAALGRDAAPSASVDSDFDSLDGAARRPYRRLRQFTAVVEISTQSQMRPVAPTHEESGPNPL